MQEAPPERAQTQKEGEEQGGGQKQEQCKVAPMMEVGGQGPAAWALILMPRTCRHMGRWVDNPRHLGEDGCALGGGLGSACEADPHPCQIPWFLAGKSLGPLLQS